MLSLFALNMEKTELKEIFRRGEINEVGYKKILNTLETQIARVKEEKQQQFAPKEYFIEPLHIRLTNIVRKLFSLPPKPADPEEVYLYYRTQYKLISTVIHELSVLENSHLIEVFNDKNAIRHICSVYKNLLANTEAHMKKEIISNEVLLNRLNQQAAKNLLRDIQNDTLMELYQKEIINTKLYILLKKELQA